MQATSCHRDEDAYLMDGLEKKVDEILTNIGVMSIATVKVSLEIQGRAKDDKTTEKILFNGDYSCEVTLDRAQEKQKKIAAWF
ncbi:MAG: hypothetical protein ACLFVS_05320 [Candidatus Acetothermia bacterium]